MFSSTFIMIKNKIFFDIKLQYKIAIKKTMNFSTNFILLAQK